MQATELRAEDRAELERLEESLWRAETRADYQVMNEVMAQDFFEFGRSGRIYERADTLSFCHRPTGAVLPFIDAVLPLPDLRIRLLNEDTAQVTYNSAVKYDGIVQHGRRSSIWSRTGRGWVLRFHQGTPWLP